MIIVFDGLLTKHKDAHLVELVNYHKYIVIYLSIISLDESYEIGTRVTTKPTWGWKLAIPTREGYLSSNKSLKGLIWFNSKAISLR
jgi:hypothetical protein